jgi:hypothetical protein
MRHPYFHTGSSSGKNLFWLLFLFRTRNPNGINLAQPPFFGSSRLIPSLNSSYYSLKFLHLLLIYRLLREFLLGVGTVHLPDKVSCSAQFGSLSLLFFWISFLRTLANASFVVASLMTNNKLWTIYSRGSFCGAYNFFSQ